MKKMIASLCVLAMTTYPLDARILTTVDERKQENGYARPRNLLVPSEYFKADVLTRDEEDNLFPEPKPRYVELLKKLQGKKCRERRNYSTFNGKSIIPNRVRYDRRRG